MKSYLAAHINAFFCAPYNVWTQHVRLVIWQQLALSSRFFGKDLLQQNLADLFEIAKQISYINAEHCGFIKFERYYYWIFLKLDIYTQYKEK